MVQEKTPTKSEIFSLVDAQSATIDDISKRLVDLENKLDRQEDRNKSMIYAVLIAFLLVVGGVAAEVLISNKKDEQYYSGLQKDVYEQNLKVQDLSNKLDNIKIRNPYLK